MEELSASELLAAFGAGPEVDIQARRAMLSGADFHVGLKLIPAPIARGILRGRLWHMQRHGRQAIGAAECLAGLVEMGEQDLHVGWVDDRKGTGYFFQIYLAPRPLRVIGCVGVDSSEGDAQVSDPAPRK
ncbi:hypothetical protein [Streptomyces sp. NRRL F-5193]|jgi:hypothetical protein|uniref:hypothetical protein n=1 Tax=Streptomyces sp. NRRL F-5193 TaxID=1463860 RepID=UPI0005BA26BD|nr:hypothetical protein [Streptomyces sp. NRRL F-5193]